MEGIEGAKNMATVMLVVVVGFCVLSGLNAAVCPRRLTGDEIVAHPKEVPPASAIERFLDGLMGTPYWEYQREARLSAEREEQKYRESPGEVTVYVNIWDGQSPDMEAIKQWPGFGTVKSVVPAPGKGRYSVVLSKDPKWDLQRIAQAKVSQ